MCKQSDREGGGAKTHAFNQLKLEMKIENRNTQCICVLAFVSFALLSFVLFCKNECATFSFRSNVYNTYMHFV